MINEKNARNRARIQGQAGVYRVASELMLRGFVPSFPSVDCGADLVLDGGIRVQVKCSYMSYRIPYPNGAYWFKLGKAASAKGNTKIVPWHPRVFSCDCEFVVLWGITENRFWIIPAALLDNRNLAVVGPRIGYFEVDMECALQLRSEGKSIEEIAAHFAVSARTMRRRFEGKYVQACNVRGLGHLIRQHEEKWDLIESYYKTISDANAIAEASVSG